MAKKNDIDVSGNLDDIGDFDFNMDESGTKKNKVAQPSKMKSDYIPSMAEGFLSGLRRELANKLPQTAGFVDEVNSAFDQVKSMTSEFTSEAGPVVRSLGRSTNRLMPLVKPFMPRSAYSWVTGKLSSIPEEDQEMSPDERLGQQITSDINAAFQGSDASAQIRSNMSEITGNMRHKAMMGSLGNLGKEMHFVSSYLQTTMTAYMKKDLELSYRQLYTQRNIASTLRATAKLVEVELKHITHNTGLPESIKAEDFKTRGTLVSTIREQAGKQLSTFIKNIKTQIFDQGKDALGMLSDAMGGMADMKELMEGMDNQPLSLKNMAAKMLFKSLGGLVGSKAGAKIAPLLKSLAKGGLEGAATDGMTKIFKFLRDKANKGGFGIFNDLLSNALPDELKMNAKFDNVAAKDPNKPVAFDISTRDAIVSVIPGWLSKIYSITQDIQDPTTKHEELVYDARTREYINPNAKQGATYEKMNKVMKGLIPDRAAGERAVAGIASSYAIHSKNKGADLTKVFDKKVNDDINRILTNIAYTDPTNGFDVNKFDQYIEANLATSDDPYINNAMLGMKPDRFFYIINLILSSITVAGEVGKREFDTRALNDIQNSIRRIAEASDAANAANVFTKVINNGTDAEIKALMAMQKKLPENMRFVNMDTGEIDQKKLREWQLYAFKNKLDFSSYTMQNKVTSDIEDATANQMYQDNPERVFASRKANDKDYVKLLQNSSKAVKEQFDAINEKARAMAYNKNTLDTLYGEDFMKVYLQQDKQLYSLYKTKPALMAFDTILAAESENSAPDMQEACAAFKAYLTTASTTKNEDDFAEAGSVLLTALKTPLYHQIAEDFLRFCTTPEIAKELLVGLDDRIAHIKGSKAIRSMYGTSIEEVVRANSRGKTGRKSNIFADSKIGQAGLAAAGRAAPGIKAGFDRAAGDIKDVFNTVTGKVKNFFNGKVDQYKKEGINGTTVFGTKIGDIKSTAKGLAEAVTGEEHKVPTPDEQEQMVEALMASNPKKYKGKRGRAKAMKEIAARIAKNQQEYETRKAQVEGVKSSFSNVTGHIKSAFVNAKEAIGSAWDEASGHVSVAENVAKIEAILEKRYGTLSEAEVKELQEKEAAATGETSTSKKKSGKGFFKSFGGMVGGALSALNPFKASPAAIAAKYKLDASAVESAFHGDFQRYFEYRKEMDTYIATHLRGGFNHAIGGLFKGLGTGVGGIARGLGTAAGGAYRGIGSAIRGVAPALGTVAGGLFHGAGAMLGGVGHAIGGVVPTAWDMTKKTVGLAKKTVKGAFKLAFTTKGGEEDDPYYALYCKDQLGEPGWEKNPILSVRQQQKGVYDMESHGRILKTDSITGPVCDQKYAEGDAKKGKILITQEDWDKGIVNVEGKSISDKAKEHSKRGGLISLRGGGLIGGALSGLGSLLGGGLSGAGTVISKLLGFDIGALKLLGKGLWTGVKGIGTGIGNALGIGNSAAAQKKKYSVILGKLDEVTVLLSAIKENTTQKKVAFDEEGDGTRDNSAVEDENYKSQKSNAVVDPKTGKPKEEVKPAKSGWQALLDFFKNPKGIFIDALKSVGVIASSTLGIAAIGGTAYLIYKGITSIVDWIKGFKEHDGTEASKAPKTMEAIRIAATTGNALTTVNATRKAMAAADKAKNVESAATSLANANKVFTNAQNTLKHAKRGKAVTAAKTALADALKTQQQAKQVLNAVDNAADTTSTGMGFMKAIKEIMSGAWTKFLQNLSKAHPDMAKSIESFGRGLTKILPNIKANTITGWIFGAVGSIFKIKPETVTSFITKGDDIATFIGKGLKGTAKVGTLFLDLLKKLLGMSVFGKLALWMFGALKCAVVKIAKFIAKHDKLTVILSELITEAFDQVVIWKAQEDSSDRYLDDYQEGQTCFFGSKIAGYAMKALDYVAYAKAFGLGGIATKGLIDLTRSVRAGVVGNSIAADNALDSAGDVDVARSKVIMAEQKKAKAVGKEAYAKKLRDINTGKGGFNDLEVDISDDVGIFSTGNAREAARKNRKDDIKLARLNALKWTSTSQIIPAEVGEALCGIIDTAFLEQKAATKNFGMAVFEIAYHMASASLEWKSFMQIFNPNYSPGLSITPESRRKDVKELFKPATEYVFNQILIRAKYSKDALYSYAKNKAAEIEKAIAEAPKPATMAPKPAVDANKAASEQKAVATEKYKGLDAIFKDISISTDSAYKNGFDVVDAILKKGWPKSGAYEYGDAIFIFVTWSTKLTVSARRMASGKCLLLAQKELRKRYLDLPNEINLKSLRSFYNRLNGDKTGFNGCYGVLKSEIESLCSKSKVSADNSSTVKTSDENKVTPEAAAPKPSIDAQKAVAEQKSQESEKYKDLDAIFKNASKTDSAYSDRDAIYEELIKKGWPKSGAYEYGDAIFVFVTWLSNLPRKTIRSISPSKCFTLAIGELRKRYNNLPKEFSLKSVQTLKCGPNEAKTGASACYVFLKSEIEKLLVSSVNTVVKVGDTKTSSDSNSTAPSAIPPKESTAAETEIKSKVAIKRDGKNDPIVANKGDLISTDSIHSTIVGNVLLPIEGERVSEYMERFKEVSKFFDRSNRSKKNPPKLLSYLEPENKKIALEVDKLAQAMGNRGARVQNSSNAEKAAAEQERRKQSGIEDEKSTAPKVKPESTTPEVPSVTPKEPVVAPAATPAESTDADPRDSASLMKMREQLIALNQIDFSKRDATWNAQVKKLGVDLPSDPDDIQDRLNELSLKIKAAKQRESGATTPTQSSPAAPEVKPFESPSIPSAPSVVPNDSTTASVTPQPVVETMAQSVAATDKKDLTTEQLVQRIAFLENLLTGKNPMTELLTRIADGTDKNNDLTELNGEAAAGQFKEWNEKLAALKKSQHAQQSLFMQASNYGKSKTPPVAVKSMINLNQGSPQGAV